MKQLKPIYLSQLAKKCSEKLYTDKLKSKVYKSLDAIRDRIDSEPFNDEVSMTPADMAASKIQEWVDAWCSSNQPHRSKE